MGASFPVYRNEAASDLSLYSFFDKSTIYESPITSSPPKCHNSKYTVSLVFSYEFWGMEALIL